MAKNFWLTKRLLKDQCLRWVADLMTMKHLTGRFSKSGRIAKLDGKTITSMRFEDGAIVFELEDEEPCK